MVIGEQCLASPRRARINVFLALVLSAMAGAANANDSGTQTPVQAVEDLFAVHFAGDMGFTHESVARKQSLLTPDLYALLVAELERPQAENEPPYINGDPFTDTQEYPQGYEVEGAEIVGDTASVAVEFTLQGGGSRRIIVLLQKVGTAWQSSDLRYEDGRTLRQLLVRP
jgi:hypothetical protein